jgi:hypothetical protein
MYRRVVSLLLLPCVLLTRSAALPHAHGSGQPVGHDLRPHIHTHPTSAPHEHGHHREGPGGHHHDDDDDDDAPESDLQPASPEPLSDHDSDAVFIPGVDAVVNSRSAVADERVTSPLWSPPGLIRSGAFWDDPPALTAYWIHPPPELSYPCALYVRHLALLI